MTLILLETGESIQSEASVYVGGPDSGGGGKEPIRVDKLSWPNPYTITFSVPSEFLLTLCVCVPIALIGPFSLSLFLRGC